MYGELEEDIFMHPPEGYNYGNKICKLKKALYGLKQAPMTWNKKFADTLKRKGLEPTQSEQCIFKNNDGSLILGIYVDDVLMLGSDEQEMKKLLEKLCEDFEMIVNWSPEMFLGMKIERQQGKVKLTQQGYSRGILEKFGMENSKPVSTPLFKGEATTEGSEKPGYPYREAVGSLLYLSGKTYPDLAQAVGFVSRLVNDPSNQRITDVKRIFRYLNGTQTQGISYCTEGENESETEIVAYCDSDYAGDPRTRKSTTGYIIFYGGGPVSWCSRKQPIVATSSTEAEYIAAADCCKEILYIKFLLEELEGKGSKAKLKVDNQSAISLIKNGIVNRRSKHIDVRFHFVHEKVKQKIIEIEYCQTEKQIADLFTKPLRQNKFNFFKKTFIV